MTVLGPMQAILLAGPRLLKVRPLSSPESGSFRGRGTAKRWRGHTDAGRVRRSFYAIVVKNTGMSDRRRVAPSTAIRRFPSPVCCRSRGRRLEPQPFAQAGDGLVEGAGEEGVDGGDFAVEQVIEATAEVLDAAGRDGSVGVDGVAHAGLHLVAAGPQPAFAGDGADQLGAERLGLARPASVCPLHHFVVPPPPKAAAFWGGEAGRARCGPPARRRPTRRGRPGRRTGSSR